MSHTWAPRPWLMTGARFSGYWSSPLAYVCAPPGIRACSRSLAVRDRGSWKSSAPKATSPFFLLEDLGEARGLPVPLGHRGDRQRPGDGELRVVEGDRHVL